MSDYFSKILNKQNVIKNYIKSKSKSKTDKSSLSPFSKENSGNKISINNINVRTNNLNFNPSNINLSFIKTMKPSLNSSPKKMFNKSMINNLRNQFYEITGTENHSKDKIIMKQRHNNNSIKEHNDLKNINNFFDSELDYKDYGCGYYETENLSLESHDIQKMIKNNSNSQLVSNQNENKITNGKQKFNLKDFKLKEPKLRLDLSKIDKNEVNKKNNFSLINAIPKHEYKIHLTQGENQNNEIKSNLKFIKQSLNIRSNSNKNKSEYNIKASNIIDKNDNFLIKYKKLLEENQKLKKDKIRLEIEKKNLETVVNIFYNIIKTQEVILNEKIKNYIEKNNKYLTSFYEYQKEKSDILLKKNKELKDVFFKVFTKLAENDSKEEAERLKIYKICTELIKENSMLRIICNSCLKSQKFDKIEKEDNDNNENNKSIVEIDSSPSIFDTKFLISDYNENKKNMSFQAFNLNSNYTGNFSTSNIYLINNKKDEMIQKIRSNSKDGKKLSQINIMTKTNLGLHSNKENFNEQSKNKKTSTNKLKYLNK